MKDGSGPKAAPQIAATAITRQGSRVAEDGVEQVAEAVVWLEAADAHLCEALLGFGELPLSEAAEHVVRLHGRVRRCLDLAVVA